MNLVVNASPLILLCKIGREELLPKLCGAIYVPDGVAAEIQAEPDDAATHALATCKWTRRVNVTVPDTIKAWDLGRDESEVLAYALDHRECRPLLDDAEGKACALALGMRPLGTGGLLILAKNKGLIGSVREVLNDMRAKGFWISDDVIHAISRIAGE